MFKVSFSDCIGVAGIALAILLVVLDKAGKLKGGWLYGLLFVAGVMTLFVAIGNEWVMDAPEKWRVWKGVLMFCTVGLTYSGIAIWIASPGETAREPELTGTPKLTNDLPALENKAEPSKPAPLSTPNSAELQFTFWPINPDNEKLKDHISLPIVNGIVTVTFSAKNVGTAQADNGQVWIQLCDECAFAEEPGGTTAPKDDPKVRRKRFDILHMGSYFEGTTLKIAPRVGLTSFKIALKYSCEHCSPVENKRPQKLTVNIEPPPTVSAQQPPLSSSLAVSQKVAEASEALRGLCKQWQYDEHSLQAEKYDEEVNEIPPLDAHKQNVKDLEFRILLLNQNYGRKVVRTVADANGLRGILRLRIPTGEEIVEDDTEEQTFQELMEAVSAIRDPMRCPASAMTAAANYIDNLGKRVPKN